MYNKDGTSHRNGLMAEGQFCNKKEIVERYAGKAVASIEETEKNNDLVEDHLAVYEDYERQLMSLKTLFGSQNTYGTIGKRLINGFPHADTIKDRVSLVKNRYKSGEISLQESKILRDEIRLYGITNYFDEWIEYYNNVFFMPYLDEKCIAKNIHFVSWNKRIGLFTFIPEFYSEIRRVVGSNFSLRSAGKSRMLVLNGRDVGLRYKIGFPNWSNKYITKTLAIDVQIEQKFIDRCKDRGYAREIQDI